MRWVAERLSAENALLNRCGAEAPQKRPHDHAGAERETGQALADVFGTLVARAGQEVHERSADVGVAQVRSRGAGSGDEEGMRQGVHGAEERPHERTPERVVRIDLGQVQGVQASRERILARALEHPCDIKSSVTPSGSIRSGYVPSPVLIA